MRNLLLCIGILCSCSIVAQKPASATGKYLMINGASIYYEEFGKGEPLILLHGFGRTLADWNEYIPAFAKKFRVIAWDMRGHGRSANPDTSETFLHSTAARDLIVFMDSLKLDKAKAIGHSSGGIILLQAAAGHPSRFEAIVPVSAQLFFSPEVRTFIKENALPEMYYEFNELENQHGKIKGRILAKQFYHFHQLEGDPSIDVKELNKVEAKALVVHGDNDFIPVSQALGIHQNLKKSNLWVVPNGWHLPHTGQNVNWFIEIVLNFLKEK